MFVLYRAFVVNHFLHKDWLSNIISKNMLLVISNSKFQIWSA